MGKIAKILDEREIGKGFYDDTARIEVEEAIHFHIDEHRFIWTKERFLKLCGLFQEAEKVYRDIGAPKQTEDMALLARVDDLGKKISHNRLAVEKQIDGKLHIHYKDLRIHLNDGDFFAIEEVVENSLCGFDVSRLSMDNIIYHPIVEDYIKFLDENIFVKGSSFSRLKELMIYYKTIIGDYSKRNLGFPKGFPGKVPDGINRDYLVSLFFDIRDKGLNKPLIAYRTKKGIQVINSHRLAVIKCLGYTEFLAIVTEPESNWEDK